MKSFGIAILILLSTSVAAWPDEVLPVQNGVITSGIGWRTDPFGSGRLFFHRGIDIAVPVGTPVRATGKGRVLFAGERSGYGSTVIIDYSNGDRTLYGHNSILRVSPGDQVESGEVVAFSGNSGRSTGPHLHLERLSGGRPFTEPEDGGREEAASLQRVDYGNQRYQLDQRMDEAVDSLLRRLGGYGAIGQGG